MSETPQAESSTVRVPLTVEQRAERADEMARLLAVISGIEDEAKSTAKKYRTEIDARMAELQQIGFTLREGCEERAQLDLTFPEEQAARALHDIAKAACSCASEDNVSPSCPLHGIGGTQANVAPTAADAQLAAEVAATFEAATKPVDPETAEMDAMFPREEPVDAAELADALRENAVDVGTVEEPPSVAQFRRGRKRA